MPLRNSITHTWCHGVWTHDSSITLCTFRLLFSLEPSSSIRALVLTPDPQKTEKQDEGCRFPTRACTQLEMDSQRSNTIASDEKNKKCVTGGVAQTHRDKQPHQQSHIHKGRACVRCCSPSSFERLNGHITHKVWALLKGQGYV